MKQMKFKRISDIINFKEFMIRNIGEEYLFFMTKGVSYLRKTLITRIIIPTLSNDMLRPLL